MKRHVFAVTTVAFALCAAAGSVSAQNAYARIAFSGNIVNSACDTSLPTLGVQDGVGRCGDVRNGAVYVEQIAMARQGSGVAMLDYFADRSGKYVVTREYR